MAKKKETTKTKTEDEVKTNEGGTTETNDTETVESESTAQDTVKGKPDFVVRMEDEAKDLKDKTDKLNAFIYDNPEYNKLGRLEQALMNGQLKSMQTYHHMLRQRINISNNS